MEEEEDEDKDPLVVECKLLICRILRFVSFIRLDYQLTEILALFHKHELLFAPEASNANANHKRRTCSACSTV